MAEVVESLTVDRPPAEVWAALSDFAGISRWAPNVDHSCLTSDHDGGVGAVRRIQTGRVTVLETVTVWEPERELAYAITGLPPVIRAVTNTWTLDGSGGSAVVTLTSQIDAGPRPPQQMAARLAGRALAKASRQMLAGLADHLRTRCDQEVSS